MNIILDVWGGDNSMDHVARMILPTQAALRYAEIELSAGYLVNMRNDLAFGPNDNFDVRSKSDADKKA